MDYVARDTQVGCSLPALKLFTVFDGALKDSAVVQFQILDEDGDQTYPGSGRETVDALQACPTGGKLGTGQYVATWPVPDDEPCGSHEIHWYYKETAASSEQQLVRPFEVLEELPALVGPAYASIANLRAEGVDTDQADDSRLLRTLILSSRLIEQITGRFFEPRAVDWDLDGHGGRVLFLDQPIIAIADLTMDVTGETDQEFEIEGSWYRVYNRHITQGLLSPDDRSNPKIEFYHGRDLYGLSNALVFPTGQQNVHVSGVFGYTDPDGTPLGTTPALLERAAELLVLRELPKLVDTDAREDAHKRWRLLEEKTREQSYKLAGPRDLGAAIHTAVGAFTGDPAIDTLLAQFLRPIALGAA